MSGVGGQGLGRLLGAGGFRGLGLLDFLLLVLVSGGSGCLVHSLFLGFLFLDFLFFNLNFFNLLFLCRSSQDLELFRSWSFLSGRLFIRDLFVWNFLCLDVLVTNLLGDLLVPEVAESLVQRVVLVLVGLLPLPVLLPLLGVVLVPPLLL